MIHRIQFGRGPGQKANLNAYRRGVLLTVFGRMRRATIFKQNNVPAPPMTSDDLKQILMRDVVPSLRDQQLDVARANIDDAMNKAPGMAAQDRYTFLFAAPRVTTVERRGFPHDDFIQHQNDRAFFIKSPVF